MVDNLQIVLKTQELLVNNIANLVRLLEKTSAFEENDRKLENIKTKLLAFQHIYKNFAKTGEVTNNIKKIIDKEIKRCRFSTGETKTSNEVSLNIPKLIGVEIAAEVNKKGFSLIQNQNNQQQGRLLSLNKIKLPETDFQPTYDAQKTCDKPFVLKLLRNKTFEKINKYQLNAEAIYNSQNLLCNLCNYNNGLEMQSQKFIKFKESFLTDQANYAKLIKTNEKHFKEFEDKLWHLVLAAKYFALRDDYRNKVKCTWQNKKQFLGLENNLRKKMEKDMKTDKIELTEKKS